MSDFNKIEKDNINVLSPFKLLVLQNFPFIEADFDAITNYQLMCKMTEYMNNINTNVNTLNENENRVYNAFNELVDYINNYFDNLDVQEEINNKLDEMVETGVLDDIINNKIFNNLNDKINNNTLQIQDNKEETNQKILTLQSQINNFRNGTPQVVNSINEMIDTTQIYILLTDKKWYYYNGDNWVIGGDYPNPIIEENSIITENVKRIDKFKIVDNGFYIKKITEFENNLAISEDGSIITFSANANQGIGGTIACFDLYTPITQEMLNTNGIQMLNEIVGNNTDIVILLPQINYLTMTSYKQNNSYYSTRYNNTNFTNYINAHLGELLQIRIGFTNTSGINITFKNNFINGYKGNNEINNFDNTIGNKPSLQIENNLNVPYNYNKLSKSFTFNFTSTKGLLFNIKNFDSNKDLQVYLNKISGDNIDIYINFTHSNGNYFGVKSLDENNIAKWNKSFFDNYNNISNLNIILATKMQNITDDNHYTATINFPIISQNPFDVDYLNTLYKIENLLNSKENINRLIDKTLMVLGDSMARGHTLARDEVWDSLIANRNNMTLINLAQNGKFYTRHQFVNNTVQEYTQEDLEQGRVTNIGVVDMIPNLDQNTDYIIVFAGSNDMNSNVTLGNFLDNNYTTFYGCLYKTFNELITKYPTQKIIVFTPYPVTNNYNRDMNYINAINEICKYFCIPVYNNYNAGLCMSNTEQKQELMLDNIHLNAKGQLRVSYKYEEQLKLL